MEQGAIAKLQSQGYSWELEPQKELQPLLKKRLQTEVEESMP